MAELSVALVTCRAWPELSAADRPYAQALRELYGASVLVARWNDPGDQPLFDEAYVAVLRSNWDYHHELAAFASWLARFDAGERRVFNQPALVQWNLEKSYLTDLAARGVRVPATLIVESDAQAIRTAVERFGRLPVVLKPAVGASGHAVYKATPSNLDAVVHRIVAAVRSGRILVQEFLPEIRAGEHSFVFIDGGFTHAFVRCPYAGRRLDYDQAEEEFRANSQHGIVVRLLTEPEQNAVAQARAVLDTLPVVPLYARVDGIFRDGGLILTELELNEPSLRLDLFPRAGVRFAEATIRRLQAA